MNERVALSYLYLTCFSDLEAHICDLDHQLEVGGAEVALECDQVSELELVDFLV